MPIKFEFALLQELTEAERISLFEFVEKTLDSIGVNSHTRTGGKNGYFIDIASSSWKASALSVEVLNQLENQTIDPKIINAVSGMRSYTAGLKNDRGWAQR